MPASVNQLVMSNQSLRPELEAALAAVIDTESDRGIRWWPGSRMAPIALRRWGTFSRRHRRMKTPTIEDRVIDLSKGLQAHFEPDVPHTHPNEWLHLAQKLADVLFNSNPKPMT